jgi:transcriptional regulator with XRE-family HTH domain
MDLLAGQCRAARALLNWSQGELGQRAQVDQKTITDFERGVRNPHPRTIEALVRVLESVGIVFIEPTATIYSGVALKVGVAPAARQPGDSTATGTDSEPGLKAAWDDFEGDVDLDALLGEEPCLNPDMAEMWRDNPELWARLSQGGRETLSMRMFGDCRAVGDGYFRGAMAVRS